MTTRLDLGPAARRLMTLAEGVTDDMLGARTPCGDYAVRDLLGHAMALTVAFRDAGAKAGTPLQDAPPAPPALDGDWRGQLPGRLMAMAEAWSAPQAWEGVTKVGGMTLPAQVAGQAGLNELVIHGWDLARALGQPYSCDEASASACMEFLSLMASMAEPGQPGPFGPAVGVQPGAPALDQAVGLSGRDPLWAHNGA